MIFQKIKGNNDTFGLEIRILSTKVYFEEIFKMRASSAKLHKKESITKTSQYFLREKMVHLFLRMNIKKQNTRRRKKTQKKTICLEVDNGTFVLRIRT